MNFTGWFRGRTPLQLAIERGLKPGGNLVAELNKLDDYTIKSKGDAKAICEALSALENRLVLQPKSGRSPLYKLAGLFQDTEGGTDACEFLCENGIPFLVRLGRKLLEDDQCDQSELLFVLKILAAYGTREGADLIIEFASCGYASDKYLWSIVMGMFTTEHPEARRVFAALSNPLPGKFLAVSLLDAANRFFIDKGEMCHPFDSDEGVKRLSAWLRDAEPQNFSYAISATAALPFIQHQSQNELFQLAFAHPDLAVQLEAAWAAAKLELPGGIEKLIRLCNDVNHSSRAKSYLKELGREEAIPEDSKRADFEALAEFSQWLAHPNELARFPDELEIVDHRELRWPTDGETKHLWLIKYRVKNTTGLAEDDEGVGLVGSLTFCLFSYELRQRHPEDGYAIHCYWEMTHGNRITDSDVEGTSEYDSLLQQWTGDALQDAKVIAVSELTPEAGYPQRLVGLASAQMNGKLGWAVLDGPQSRWYSTDEMPEENHPKSVLMVHIGRRLLGLQHEPDRKSFLKKPPELPPAQIKDAYEKLISDAGTGSAAQRAKLLGNHGLLGKHFDAYVGALHSLRGGCKAQQFAEAYDKLLVLAREHPAESVSLFETFSPLGEAFENYVDALIELGRKTEIIPLVELFEPVWKHNLGYGLLASAAYKAGCDDIAEKFCLQLKEGLEDWQRSEEMSHLAEIWHRQGKRDEARALLLECMRKMLEEGHRAEDSDKKLHEEWFQNHRRTFLRLFAGEPLREHGLPETTFQ